MSDDDLSRFNPQPPPSGRPMSGRLLFFVGLALFVVGLLWYGGTDDPAQNTVISIVGFWIAIPLMIVGGVRWRRDRRIARGESIEAVEADQQHREELSALSYWTGVKTTRIERELSERGITPAQWADEHDIDPTTWRPRGRRAT